MGDFSELNRLQPPEEAFDNSPIKLGEVKELKSTPGINGISYKSTPDISGISYKLYERCPNVLTSLWKLPRVVHINRLSQRIGY